MQNINYVRIFIISFLVGFLYSCSKANDNQVDAWLFEVVDNYPLPTSKTSRPAPSYTRVIQFKYMIRNNTFDTLFVPINVVNGYNTFNSRVKMGIDTHYINNLLDQKLTRGKKDVILAPNKQTCITITLYSQDIESLGLKRTDSLANIVKRISFIYSYSNSDVSRYTPIQLIFHNSNETDWIDLRGIKEEKERQWSVCHDSIRNILLINYIPQTRIQEVKSTYYW